MQQEQVLPGSSRARANREIVGVVACMAAPVVTPTLILVAFAAGASFGSVVGALGIAAITSTLLWYHSFRLHTPARYCGNKHATEQPVEDEGVNTDTESPTGERDRTVEDLLAVTGRHVQLRRKVIAYGNSREQGCIRHWSRARNGA